MSQINGNYTFIGLSLEHTVQYWQRHIRSIAEDTMMKAQKGAILENHIKVCLRAQVSYLYSYLAQIFWGEGILSFGILIKICLIYQESAIFKLHTQSSLVILRLFLIFQIVFYQDMDQIWFFCLKIRLIRSIIHSHYVSRLKLELKSTDSYFTTLVIPYRQKILRSKNNLWPSNATNMF